MFFCGGGDIIVQLYDINHLSCYRRQTSSSGEVLEIGNVTIGKQHFTCGSNINNTTCPGSIPRSLEFIFMLLK